MRVLLSLIVLFWVGTAGAQSAKSLNKCAKPSDCPRGLTCSGSLKMPFRCVNPQTALCRASEGCQLEGLCTASNGKCMAKSTIECQSSLACAESGRCTARSGVCTISGSVDCAKSKGCRENGQCSFDDGACVVKGDRVAELCGL